MPIPGASSVAAAVLAAIVLRPLSPAAARLPDDVVASRLLPAATASEGRQLQRLCRAPRQNASRAHLHCAAATRGSSKCRCLVACDGDWRDKLPQLMDALGLDALQGEIYEFGVFDGQSLERLRSFFPRQKLWGFDSFRGFPPETADHQQMDFRPGHYATTRRLSEMLAKLGGPGLAGLLPGFFNVSLTPGLRAERGMGEALYVDVDADLYTGSYQALDWAFSSKVVRPGTLVGYDDWWTNPCSRGGELLSPLATGEGRAHNEIAERHRVRFSCVAGACRFLPEEARCVSAWGVIFVVESIGAEALPHEHGFEMSESEVRAWKGKNRLCQKHLHSPYHWLYSSP